jgi:hypothetical protein
MERAKPLLLEGIVEPVEQPDSQDYRRELQSRDNEIRSLRHALDEATAEKDGAIRTVRNLQSMLAPLHRALRAIFGEIELVAGEDAAPAVGNGASVPVSGQDPRWESFKRSFPGVGAEIIDALLIHGEMKMTNLSKLLKRHYNTVQFHAAKLRAAGAITSAGGLLSLKR